MIRETSELTKEQLDRIDVVQNAAHEFCKILSENPDIAWDMSYIGAIAEMASEILYNHEIQVRYPSIVSTGWYPDTTIVATIENAIDTKTYTVDFYGEG